MSLYCSKRGGVVVELDDRYTHLGDFRVTFPNGSQVSFDRATFEVNFSRVENTSLKRKEPS